MFVDATLNSELKNRIQKSANKNKVPFKVIEKVDKSIKGYIQKNSPFPALHCGRTYAPCICNITYINSRWNGI